MRELCISHQYGEPAYSEVGHLLSGGGESLYCHIEIQSGLGIIETLRRRERFQNYHGYGIWVTVEV